LHDAVTPAMRDNLNFNMLPIVQDNMTCVPGALTNLSSNGYYGYQAPLDKRKNEPLEPHACYMEVQCETASHRGSRKRAWELADDFREFKKRRQNESSPFGCEPAPTPPNREAKLRHVADMPRCIMGHYI
jgi:hypothetical protein